MQVGGNPTRVLGACAFSHRYGRRHREDLTQLGCASANASGVWAYTFSAPTTVPAVRSGRESALCTPRRAHVPGTRATGCQHRATPTPS